jgi:hypothetical protein
VNLPTKPLSSGDLRELVERRSDWDDVTEVDLSVQHLHGPYPTLHAIGLGPQLAELERICAESQRGKHAGESVLEVGFAFQMSKAIGHMFVGDSWAMRDPESNARHLIHAAARLLMAAACADHEGRP